LPLRPWRGYCHKRFPTPAQPTGKMPTNADPGGNSPSRYTASQPICGSKVAGMGHRIRAIEPRDGAAVSVLSLRAWAPVFESMRTVMGERVFTGCTRIGEWRRTPQSATCARPTRRACGSASMTMTGRSDLWRSPNGTKACRRSTCSPSTRRPVDPSTRRPVDPSTRRPVDPSPCRRNVRGSALR
jgi:hypothetical protein